MRLLHLYELDWCDAPLTENRTVWGAGNRKGYKVIAKTVQAYSNKGIRNLYNYLRANGNRPYMTELPNGDIRIQYFKKGGDD